MTEDTLTLTVRQKLEREKLRLQHVADLVLTALNIDPEQTTTSLLTTTRNLDRTLTPREITIAIYETLTGRQLRINGDGSVHHI